jgi:hypothetical protein
LFVNQHGDRATVQYFEDISHKYKVNIIYTEITNSLQTHNDDDDDDDDDRIIIIMIIIIIDL